MTGGGGRGPLNSPGRSIFGSLHLSPYVLVPTCIQTNLKSMSFQGYAVVLDLVRFSGLFLDQYLSHRISSGVHDVW